MPRRRRANAANILRQHSLSLILAGILFVWLMLYWASDKSTHLGAFYGNAVADWLGVLVFIVATKYFFEIGSRESRPPTPRVHQRVARFLVTHSLTLVLALTGIVWTVVYARSDADGKAGAVLGNIVSEWTQILGLVVITKYARETKSTED